MATGQSQSLASFLAGDRNLQKHIEEVCRRWLYREGYVQRPAALTPEQVQQIIRRVQNGERQAAVARDFGVTRVTVHYIVKKGRGQRRLARLAPTNRVHTPDTQGNEQLDQRLTGTDSLTSPTR